MPESPAEQLPSSELEKPSSRVVLHVLHGQFDTDKPFPDQIPNQVSAESLTALNKQNTRIRQEDEARVARMPGHEKMSPQDIRTEHLKIWGKFSFAYMINDVSIRGEKIATIFSQKLGIPITAGMDKQAFADLEKYFYDPQTQTEGAFYKKFCGNNMNETLAEALTVEDMMLLKSFLTKWMVGTETAFHSLVALRAAKDVLADETKQAQLSNTAPLSAKDKKIVSFYQEGLTLEEEKPQPTTQEKEEEQAPTSITGGATEAHPEHPDRNDDIFFLDPEKQQGGIFDGAGGYANGNLASKIARDAIQEVLAKLPSPVQEKQATDALSDALRLADERVKALGQQGKTTAAVFQVVENPDGSRTLWTANVGDSRIWIRHKDGTITQVTQDGGRLRDLYTEQLGNASSKEEGEAVTSDYNNIVEQLNNAQSQADIANQQLNIIWAHRNETNLLGSEKPLEEIAELIHAPLQDGDTIFMTTDGVHDNLTTAQIAELAKETADPQAFAQRLVAQAKEVSDNNTFRSKPDDITAAAVRLASKPQQEKSAQ